MGVWPPSSQWRDDFIAGSPLHRVLAGAFGALRSETGWPSPEGLSRDLAERTQGIVFVEDLATQSRRPRARSVADLYDVRIAERGEVPTRRESWHDLLNALVWASFPRAKRALSARQARLHRARLGETFVRLPSARLPEQDCLSLLDEGGVILSVESALVAEVAEALAAADTARLEARCREGRVAPWLFGHALHEHLVADLRDARAGVHVVCCAHRLDAVDAAMAARLADPTQFLTRPTLQGVRLATLEAWARPEAAGP